jgi:hypothetical protein
MGWMSGFIVQGVLSFVLLGTLKRAGVIRCVATLLANSPVQRNWHRCLLLSATYGTGASSWM